MATRPRRAGSVARLNALRRETARYVGATGGGGLGPLTLSPATATVGVAYSGTISGRAAGSTFALSGAGAAGLTVNSTTGAVSGTPTTAGAVNIVETLAGATGSPRTSSGVLLVGSGAVGVQTLIVFGGQSNFEYAFLRGGPPKVAAIYGAEELRALSGSGRSTAFTAYNTNKIVHDGSSQSATDWSVRYENTASGGSALISSNGGQTAVQNAYSEPGNYWWNAPGTDNSAATGNALDNNASGSGYTPGPLARRERDRIQALVAAGVTISGYAWSQGATDQGGFSTDATRAAAYQTCLADVHFAGVRTWAGNANLPVFISMHHRHQTASEADTEVLRGIQRAIIAAQPGKTFPGNEEYAQVNAIGAKTGAVATITAGSNVVQITDTTGISVPQRIVGPGIPEGAYVSAMTANTSITLSKRTNGVDAPANATASASGAVLYVGDNVHLFPGLAGIEPYDANGATEYGGTKGYALMLKQQARFIAKTLGLSGAPANAQGPFISGGSYTRGATTARVAVTHVAGTDFAAGQIFDTAGWRVASGAVVYPVTAVTKVDASTLDLTVSRPLYPEADGTALTVQYAYGAMNRTIAAQLLVDNASPIVFPMQSRAPSGITVSEPGYDARSQSIFTAMQNDGSAPGSNLRAAIDACVRAYNAVNAWTFLDRHAVEAVHSQVAALVDWANPSGARLTLVGSPTFTPYRGFTDPSNGGAIKLDFGYSPNGGGTKYLLDNAYAAMFVVATGAYSSPDIVDSQARLNVRGRQGTVALIRMNTATNTAFTDAATAPFKISRRPARRGQPDRPPQRRPGHERCGGVVDPAGGGAAGSVRPRHGHHLVRCCSGRRCPDGHVPGRPRLSAGGRRRRVLRWWRCRPTSRSPTSSASWSASSSRWRWPAQPRRMPAASAVPAWGRQGRPGSRERAARPDRREMPVPKVQQVRPGRRERQAPAASPATKARPVRPALKVRRAMQALLVQLAQLDPPAPRAHKAALDLQALLDPQEPKVRRG